MCWLGKYNTLKDMNVLCQNFLAWYRTELKGGMYYMIIFPSPQTSRRGFDCWFSNLYLACFRAGAVLPPTVSWISIFSQQYQNIVTYIEVARLKRIWWLQNIVWLQNNLTTENPFRLDVLNSHKLNISVKYPHQWSVIQQMPA